MTAELFKTVSRILLKTTISAIYANFSAHILRLILITKYLTSAIVF